MSRLFCVKCANPNYFNRLSRANDVYHRYMGKTYCKPLKRGASWRSQNFGASSTIYGPHSGNDEACNIGTPVHAAGDGVVEFAGVFDDTYADNLLWLHKMGGNVLVLNCGDDEPSFVYAHLNKFHVKQGDRVSKGQHIADSGNSGTATTGAHLHVEAIPPGYNLNSHLLGRVNPDFYMTEWPEDVKVIQTHSTETVEEEKMTDAQMVEIKKFFQDEIERRKVAIVKELKEYIDSAVLELKVFEQTDSENRHLATRKEIKAG